MGLVAVCVDGGRQIAQMFVGCYIGIMQARTTTYLTTGHTSHPHTSTLCALAGCPVLRTAL